MEELIPLRYGDPPSKSECRDLGSRQVPDILANSDPDMGGNFELYSVYGSRLPKWSQVRYLMRMLRAEQKPYRVKVKGLGEIRVGEEGWEVS